MKEFLESFFVRGIYLKECFGESKSICEDKSLFSLLKLSEIFDVEMFCLSLFLQMAQWYFRKVKIS